MVQIGTNSKKPLGDAPLAQVSKGEDGKKMFKREREEKIHQLEKLNGCNEELD